MLCIYQGGMLLSRQAFTPPLQAHNVPYIGVHAKEAQHILCVSEFLPLMAVSCCRSVHGKRYILSWPRVWLSFDWCPRGHLNWRIMTDPSEPGEIQHSDIIICNELILFASFFLCCVRLLLRRWFCIDDPHVFLVKTWTRP